MCEKIITKCHSKEVDPCLVDEINELKTTEWNKKFMSIMSCCGHGKYSKSLIVKNRASSAIFEWYSGIALIKKKRSGKSGRKGFYKRDDEGHYYIPEVVNHKEYQMVRVLFSEKRMDEHWLECENCKYTLFRKGREKKFLESITDYWLSTKWICVFCGEEVETTNYINKYPVRDSVVI